MQKTYKMYLDYLSFSNTGMTTVAERHGSLPHVANIIAADDLAM